MPKDNLSMNPAAAHRKAEKQKALKKNKSDALARRNEKLARRNPDRISRQINDIKSLQESGQKLRPREEQLLDALQRDLRSVQKAREALGEKAPKFDTFESRRGGGERGGRGRGGGGVLGKRRRDGGYAQHSGDESSETDEEVRKIPMPRDTPPPIPREYQRKHQPEGKGARGPHPLPNKPAAEARTVYEAQPEIRNLRQEATNRFIPAAVRAKQDAIRGQGKLLEPEEMDRLEKSGYQAGPAAAAAAGGDDGEDDGDGDDEDAVQRRLLEEERRFNQEMKAVQIEEVEDEDA